MGPETAGVFQVQEFRFKIWFRLQSAGYRAQGVGCIVLGGGSVVRQGAAGFVGPYPAAGVFGVGCRVQGVWNRV